MHIYSRANNVIARSLMLDFLFFRLSIPLSQKVEFLIKKYVVILIFFLTTNKKKLFKVDLFNDKFYFDDIYNFTYIQNVYIESSFLKNFIPMGSIIIDIGANIGQFNFFARHYLKASKIYSIEPIKSTFEILKLNTQSKNVYNYAISTNNKETFYIPGSTLIASKCNLQENSQKEIVNCIKIDNLHDLKRVNKIDLLKIDTEGSEYDTLTTSKNILKKTKHIFLEASVNRKSSKQIIEILILLKRFLPHVRLIQMDKGSLVNGVLETVNLLFVNNK